MKFTFGIAAALMLSMSCAHADNAPKPNGRVIDLTLAGGRQRVLLVTPPHPRGVIVMLPGGAGNVGIEADGKLRHGDNFLVRSRALWAARGYAVLVPDALDHMNLRGQRSTPRYAEVVTGLVRFAHAQVKAPVFLIGTSQGAIAAMNGAAHLTPAALAGVVFTESVSVLGGSHETVFDAQPQNVTVPALVVANRDDKCRVAPPSEAQKIADAMTKSPQAKVLYVEGGVTRSRDCGSLSPHGYYGIEADVVDKIVAWLNSHSGS